MLTLSVCLCNFGFCNFFNSVALDLVGRTKSLGFIKKYGVLYVFCNVGKLLLKWDKRIGALRLKKFVIMLVNYSWNGLKGLMPWDKKWTLPLVMYTLIVRSEEFFWNINKALFSTKECKGHYWTKTRWEYSKMISG